MPFAQLSGTAGKVRAEATRLDSTMVRNAKNGYKGNFFIQFSFSFASVGVGHDLRAAVDISKGRFWNTGGSR